MYDEDQARYASDDLLKHNGFIYFRVAREGTTPDLYTQKAIEAVAEVIQHERLKYQAHVVNDRIESAGHDYYNTWTTLHNLLRLMKYHLDLPRD